MTRQARDLESTGRAEEARTLEQRHLEKIRSITLPTLTLHGEWDEMVSLSRAIELFNTLTMEHKRLEIIPGAGHNDILWVGLEQYLAAVRAFVLEQSQ